jgi:hypothetical protein
LRPTRVLKSESFRSAALFATLFLILSWVLLGVVYWIVDDTQKSALVGSIDADINTIRNGYREKGLSEAIEVVHQRLGSGEYSGADLAGGYILLHDAATGTVAGNVQQPADFQLGLFRFSVPRRHDSAVNVLGRGVYIAGGIVPRLGARFAESGFRERFEAKGRLGTLLAAIPTYVVTHKLPAFLGCAAALAAG